MYPFRNKASFYSEELLAALNPKLERHPLTAVRYCLFDIFSSTLYIEVPSSILNLRTSYTVVTGVHLQVFLDIHTTI